MENQPVINPSGTTPINPAPIIQTSITPQAKTNLLIPISLTVLVSAFIFGFGGYYLGVRPLNLPTLFSAQPTSNNDQIAHWKTYSNSDMSVSFKYPGDIFIYQGDPQKYQQYWSNDAKGGSPVEMSEKGIWMDLTVTPNLDDYAYNLYKDKTASGVWSTTYDEPRPNSEISYSYTASQLRGRMLYQLFIASNNDENLKKYKGTFEQILTTFNFSKRALN